MLKKESARFGASPRLAISVEGSLNLGLGITEQGKGKTNGNESYAVVSQD